MKLKAFFTVIFITFIFFIGQGQTLWINWPEVTNTKDLVDTRSRPINFQVKKDYDFSSIGVSIGNKFDGARLSHASLINDSTVSVLIRPENYPINMSPWYSFKLWGKKETDLYIQLKYEHGRHRYPPKLSHDGKNWTLIKAGDLFSQPKDSTAFFRVHVGKDTTWVSAQELMTSASMEKWTDELAKKSYINKIVIGHTVQERPLTALTISESNGKNLLVVLSRQHPPEITGYKEMIAFVETLTGDSRKARKFREKFEIIVVPMMNPDGVDNGHWRHNMGGIDLNRDWRFFNQPETSGLRKFMLNVINEQNAKVRFSVDFHSTQKDLFYLFDKKDLPGNSGIALDWLNAINKKFPEHPFTAEPTGFTAQISKNWFFNELRSESITYEVGDNTDRNVIKKRGETAAFELIRILLKQSKAY
jgi:predicted deacylase